MNFLNIFVFIAVVLALFTAPIDARRKGGKPRNTDKYWRAGSHVAGKAVEGVAAAAVQQAG
uniref:Uncharacterized protein n=1 Tax=Stomoxys calcitrans TaxID=35570 RepID=A0A905STF1_STOCA